MTRKVSEEERRLFRRHAAHGPLQLPAALREASAKAGGTYGGRGPIAPEARIDLHGMTQAEAYAALSRFVAGARQKGFRRLLVITGVGGPGADEGAEWTRPRSGVLKEMVPRWLGEKEFAAAISGWTPAHRRDGGSGALYVSLRKSSHSSQ